MIDTPRENHQHGSAAWAALAGRWEFSGADAKYVGPKDAAAPQGLALSSFRIRDGKVSVDVTPSLCSEGDGDPAAGVVVGYDGLRNHYALAQLGGWGAAYSIGEYTHGLGWRAIERQGSVQNLRADRAYSLEVVQRGQTLSLSVDGVKVIDRLLPAPLQGTQVGLCAWGGGESVFKDFHIEGALPRLFVAMQFSEPFNTLYEEVIRPRGTTAGFDVVRIDDVTRPGIIFQDIQQEIADAKAIVAEISAANSNVFYELGYAHALNKPTILLAQRGRELPFDVRSYRVIFYDDTIGGRPQVEQTLEKHLHAILRDD